MYMHTHTHTHTHLSLFLALHGLSVCEARRRLCARAVTTGET